MSKENYEKSANDDQASTQAAIAPSASENTLMIKRPRPGSVVILAPPYNASDAELDEIVTKMAQSVKQVLKAAGVG